MSINSTTLEKNIPTVVLPIETVVRELDSKLVDRLCSRGARPARRRRAQGNGVSDRGRL